MTDDTRCAFLVVIGSVRLQERNPSGGPAFSVGSKPHDSRFIRRFAPHRLRVSLVRKFEPEQAGFARATKLKRGIAHVDIVPRERYAALWSGDILRDSERRGRITILCDRRHDSDAFFLLRHTAPQSRRAVGAHDG